jgi:hypothetical protein
MLPDERKQNIFEEKACLQKNRLVSEGKVRGLAFMWITENFLTVLSNG